VASEPLATPRDETPKLLLPGGVRARSLASVVMIAAMLQLLCSDESVSFMKF
jgi:hypothetical protein